MPDRRLFGSEKKCHSDARRVYSDMKRHRRTWAMHERILYRLFGRRNRYTQHPACVARMSPTIDGDNFVPLLPPGCPTRQALPQRVGAKHLFPLYKRIRAENRLTAVWYVG
jgi:hypothetical protein